MAELAGHCQDCLLAVAEPQPITPRRAVSQRDAKLLPSPASFPHHQVLGHTAAMHAAVRMALQLRRSPTSPAMAPTTGQTRSTAGCSWRMTNCSPCALSCRRTCQARLATLSACETGIVGTDLPDEVVMLPSALLEAGYAGVAASLWSVADFSTAMLMVRFYQCWRQKGWSRSLLCVQPSAG